MMNVNNRIFCLKNLKIALMINVPTYPCRFIFLMVLFNLSFITCLNAQTTVFAELSGSPNVNTTGWTITGSAQPGDSGGDPDNFDNEIVLTPNQNSQSGGIFFDQPFDLSTCTKWKVEFDFRIWQGNGADGIAFCFLDNPPTGFGAGAGVGIPAVSNGIFVVLDTYDNGCGQNPEIQLYQGIGGVGYSECGSGMISRVTGVSSMRSSVYQTCSITYSNGIVNVSINGAPYLSGVCNVNLLGYMGFTASTGSLKDKHSIRNVKIFADIASANAGPDITICSGDIAQLGENSDASYSYNWSGGPNLSSNSISDPTISVTNNTNDPISYSYIVQTINNGMPESCPGSDTLVVTINPIPTVNAGEDIQECQGTAITLIGSGADTYTWTEGVSNGESFTPAVGTAIYTLTGLNSYGCDDTDQLTVLITPEPVVNGGPDQTLCSGQPVILNASGANSYTWSNGNTNGVGFYQNEGTTIYSVTGTSIYGCTGTDTVSVTIESSPTVEFSTDVTSGCAPLTVSFTNNSVNGETCLWGMGNDLNTVEGCGTVSYTFMSGGCYDISLTVTSNNGCESNIIYPELVCVKDQPVASFSASNYYLTELDALVSFTNESENAITYLWDFGDLSLFSTLENPVHDYQGINVGTYLVTLIATSPYGCQDTTYSFLQMKNEILFYAPNSFTPDNDEFNQTWGILTQGIDPNDFSLYLFNRWGELIWESHNPEAGWDGSYAGNIAPSGTYTWKALVKSTLNDEKREFIGHLNVLR
jgi:gliding motility-associated-like protein